MFTCGKLTTKISTNPKIKMVIDLTEDSQPDELIVPPVKSSKTATKQQSSSTASSTTSSIKQQNEVQFVKGPRIAPANVATIANLSDRQYCCVWGVEVFEDAPQKEVVRSLLAKIARHVNPILRERGWRVKRLIESTSITCAGVCHGNGR